MKATMAAAFWGMTRYLAGRLNGEMNSYAGVYNLAKATPFVRGFAYEVSPYHTGSVLENKLGLQIFRSLGKNFAWHLRKSRIVPGIETYLEDLQRDGLLLIPNFLAPTEFAQVKEEVAGLRSRFCFKSFREAENGRLQVAKFQPTAQGEDFPCIRKYLQENALIQNIAAAVVKRPITSKPPVLISVYRKANASAPDNDVENVLHADLHAPTVKAFYYLNDIDQSNGAFIYAKGSHKLTLNRLWHEYDMSVRTAKLKRGANGIPENLLVRRGPNQRNIVAERHRRRMNIAETHVCARANTLVIANNMGFHRRGEFSSEEPRETILLNFRHLEHCW